MFPYTAIHMAGYTAGKSKCTTCHFSLFHFLPSDGPSAVFSRQDLCLCRLLVLVLESQLHCAGAGYFANAVNPTNADIDAKRCWQFSRPSPTSDFLSNLSVTNYRFLSGYIVA